MDTNLALQRAHGQTTLDLILEDDVDDQGGQHNNDNGGEEATPVTLVALLMGKEG